MAYLNCPNCRLTVHSLYASGDDCPRCGARLGPQVRRLFQSPVPPRVRASRPPAKPPVPLAHV
jgi:hypothetical protein